MNDAAGRGRARGEDGVRRLCVCADDFGLTEGINKAVYALAEKGVLSATACMVKRRSWVAGARELRRMDGAAFDVGLHLDLTGTLDGSVREQSLLPLLARSFLRSLDADTLKLEIDEQLDRFESALGRPPAFIDGHRHVHQLPVVRDAMLDVLSRRYALRPWIRSTRPRSWMQGAPLKSAVVHLLGGVGLDRRTRRRGFPAGRALVGVYGFQGSVDRYRVRLERWLAQCAEGDVLMCHPAISLAEGDPIAAARVREYAVLASLGRSVATLRGSIRIVPLSHIVAMPRIGSPA